MKDYTRLLHMDGSNKAAAAGARRVREQLHELVQNRGVARLRRQVTRGSTGHPA